jgi:hypothetical protein
MSRFSNMKLRTKIAVGATLGAAVIGGGGMLAFAYFTSTGTGTGSALVGSASNWTVGQTGTSSGGPVYPDASIGVTGGHVQTDSYTVTNAGKGSQFLTQVQVSIANANGSAWSSQTNPSLPACTAASFSVGGQAVSAVWTDTSLAGDFTSNQSKTGSVTVEMIDNGANQNNCQGVTVPLYFSAS